MAVHDVVRATEPPGDDNEHKPAPEYPEILKQKIIQVIEALYEKYKHYGAELAHFRPVKVGNTLVVAYVGDKNNNISHGLDLGKWDGREQFYRRSWNNIFANEVDQRYEVGPKDEKYDTRQGMTKELQRELFAQGFIAADENGKFKSQIWLTGEEPIDDRYALVTGRELNDGKITFAGGYRENKKNDFLFCPAVVIIDDLTACLEALNSQ